MASIIRIKRSSSSTAPTTLGNGELAYSAGSGSQANGGERLYIGFGTETAGGAPQFVIGGKYFTDLLDHVHGTLTANSALIADSSSKLNNLKVDNLDLNDNTVSSTDTNGNIILDPNGTGLVSVTKAANIGGTLAVTGATTLSSTLGVTGATTLSSTLGVTGATTLSSTLAVTGDVSVNTNKFNVTAASGNTAIAGTLGVTGATTLSSTLAVTGATTLSSTLGVTGATTLSSTLGVTGATTLSSTLAVTGDVSVNTNKFNVTAASGNTAIAGTLSVAGATTLTGATNIVGDFSVATNKFTIAAASGNTVVAGTLQAGATTLSSATITNNLTVNGTFNSDDITAANISVAGNATITGNLTVQGTTTTVNSTAVSIADVNLTLAKDATNSAQADGAGFTVAGANATIVYASVTDDWTFNKNVNAPNLTVSGAITGNASSATKWQTARNLSLTGDATATLASVDGTANVSAALTLATVNTNVGTYGSSTSVPTFIVNAKGLITAASQTAIPIATTSVNGLASFTSTEFTVTSGLVSINQIDGGTY